MRGFMSSLSRLDHPVVLALTMTLVVFAVGNLLGMTFKALGWSGPARFFHMGG